MNIEGFALSVHEITRGQFAEFVSATGYRTEAEKDSEKGCYSWVDGKWGWNAGSSWRDPGFEQNDRHPVVCVSWNDAKAYVDWLKRETGKAYRLPSEAQWEYAARAKSQNAYFFGEQENRLCDYGNVADQTKSPDNQTWKDAAECEDGYWFTSPVGSFQSNGFGLKDTIGNVWEWAEDCWNGSYAGAPTDGSAWTSGDCSRRVLRGGSWNIEPGRVRSADRDGYGRDNRDGGIGFRVAQDL